uniref:Uncharacterized protein n=1 Tax=Chenopodium quinoa TaxID=63459 RepID=A0A803MLD5_CHEQI
MEATGEPPSDNASSNTIDDSTCSSERAIAQNGEAEAATNGEVDLESLHQPLLRRNRTLSASHLAMVGAKVSHIESLDYEINENDLFKQDWRSRSKVQNIAGYKLLLVSGYVQEKRYMMGLFALTGANFLLTLIATVLVVFFAPTAAGPGIPEIKAYLNGIDTPNMYGASTLFVKNMNLIPDGISLVIPIIGLLGCYLSSLCQIIGSIGAVSAGLDLGKEGPLVHIGACIASLLGQGGTDKHRVKWRWYRIMNNDRDRRDLITCGASSGVCAAFRSPVGGVLFALEEVATWWRSAILWRTFFSTAVVVVVLRTFIEFCSSGQCGLFGNGGLIMFDVSNVTVRYHMMDIIPIALIGLIGGVLGSLYNYALHKVLRLYSLINERGKLAKILLSLTVSVFTSVCMYGLPFLVGCTKCDTSISNFQCSTTGRTGNFKRFNCPEGYYNDLASLLFSTNDDAV